MKRLIPVLAASAVLSGCVVVPAPVPVPHPHAHGGKDVVLCHKGKKTMTLPAEAADAHYGHGDTPGPC